MQNTLPTQEQIETEYNGVLAHLQAVKVRSKGKEKLTNHEKLFIKMARHPQKIWWLPHDLQGADQTKGGVELFIGYEVTARLSELAQDKNLIESRPAGKYEARRLRFETPETQAEIQRLKTKLSKC